MSEDIELTVFESKEAKKLLTALRQKLKRKNIQLRVSHKVFDYGGESKQELHLKSGFREESYIYLETINNHILELSLGYSVTEYEGDVFIEYGEKMASLLKFPSLIIKKRSSKAQLRKECKPIPATKDEYFLFVSSYGSSEELFYINIVKNYVENKINVLRRVNNKFNSACQDDPTITFKQVNIREGKWEFYYKGFEGNIEVTVTEVITIQCKEIEYESTLESPDNIPESMDEIFEQCHAQVKLKSLIDPPKKHFRNLLSSNFSVYVMDDNIIDKIFSLLLDKHTPEELELGSLTQIAQFKKINNHSEKVFLFTTFSRYFVFSKDFCEGYDDFSQALNQYEEICYNIAEKNYVEEKNEIKRKITYLRTKI